MNYSNIYNQIIERGKLRILKSYTERHHIIPKCMGGTNEPENMVQLTTREHFICHKLLTEIYPNECGLHRATFMMCTTKNKLGRDYKIGAREYQRLKENIVVSAETRRKISNIHKGKIVSKETRKKLRDINLGNIISNDVRIKIGNFHRGKIVNKETRKKMSIAHQNRSLVTREKLSKGRKGKHHTDETRKKLRDINLGNVMSDETKQKISITNSKPQKKVKCPHCKKFGGQSGMTRYHFNNCKLKK